MHVAAHVALQEMRQQNNEHQKKYFRNATHSSRLDAVAKKFPIIKKRVVAKFVEKVGSTQTRSTKHQTTLVIIARLTLPMTQVVTAQKTNTQNKIFGFLLWKIVLRNKITNEKEKLRQHFRGISSVSTKYLSV